MLNMPPVTKNLIIINLLMFFAMLVASKYAIGLTHMLGLHYFMSSDFKLYQLFTYMFMHGGWEHIFFNMFAVWMFGRIMEQVMGSKKFLFYYIVCGLGAAVIQEGVQFFEYTFWGDHLVNVLLTNEAGESFTKTMTIQEELLYFSDTVGASGAVYGILLSFGMTFPEERMFIIPIPFPIKAKWFVMGYAIIELLSALHNPGDGIAHMAHLGGMLFGLALILYWRRHNGNGGRGGRFFGGGGGFGGYDNYFTRYEDVTNTNNQRTSVTTRIKQWWSSVATRFRRKPKMKVNVGHGTSKHDADMQWRRQQQEREQEIDRILAKVKQGGYSSLTDEEKRKLFEASER